MNPTVPVTRFHQEGPTTASPASLKLLPLPSPVLLKAEPSLCHFTCVTIQCVSRRKMGASKLLL